MAANPNPKMEDPNKDLNEAIAAIPRMSGDVQKVMDLCDVLITHLRIDNDTATTEEATANRGGLRELKRLKMYVGSRNG
jgi:hypothetical protein